MTVRALLDSNVFLFAFERPESNSKRIVSRMVDRAFEGIVTDRVVREIIRYFRRHYDKDLASKYRDLILTSCDLVLEEDWPAGPAEVALVGRKDAGALAAARGRGIARIVSTDSDFKGVPEWRTPREFVLEQGWRARAGIE